MAAHALATDRQLQPVRAGGQRLIKPLREPWPAWATATRQASAHVAGRAPTPTPQPELRRPVAARGASAVRPGDPQLLFHRQTKERPPLPRESVFSPGRISHRRPSGQLCRHFKWPEERCSPPGLVK